MPKVSIIIPTYNVEMYLRECLDSVVNQTLKDIEIICVDDGATDNSGKILDEYAAHDSRIKVIHKENGGYGKAMNVGIDNATGEYIGIVEPDDYIDYSMYEDLYKIANKYNSDIVKSTYYENIQTKDFSNCSKAQMSAKLPIDKSFTLQEYPYFLSYHPSIWTCIYRREFLNSHNIRFVEAPGSGWTDNPFQVQTMCLAEKINYTSKAYYCWRNTTTSASEALKNYRLPFDRSKEIHAWLENNNIQNPMLLKYLYRRELKYIQIVLGMHNITNLLDCYKQIRLLTSKMDAHIIYNSNFFSKFEKSTFFLGKFFPIILHLKIQYGEKIKLIFSIRNDDRKSHKVITVLGIKFKFKKRRSNAKG